MKTIIRQLTEADLPAARRIVCSSFGTFLGASDPENFWADRDYVYGRFGAEHVATFGAELNGELVGSNFATRWGSVGFLGPISVRPDRQALGIAKGLINDAAGVDRLDFHLDRELEQLARIADGADFAEGITAFFEKRPPVFESKDHA
jgi:enoyl-CoA hydratase/carnithine racemase